VLVGVQSRLAYPVGYWNALAGLIAIGLPLLLWAATSARAVALRSLAAAAVPALALAAYFTYSRGGLAAAAIAVVVLIVLSERRLALVLPLGALAVGSGFVVWQASIRHQLSDGLLTDTAAAQGDSMLIIVGGVAAIAAATIAALTLLERRERIPRAPAVPRRIAAALTAAAALVAIIAFVAVGGPGEVSDGWEEFKEPAGLSDTSSRLESVAGNGRWQYWSAAADAGSDAPLKGIGPGTFVFYWQQFRDIDNGFVRDAHSLFAEVYGELGVIGVVLIGGFVLFVLGVGVRRLWSAAGERRAELAAAVAAAAGFTIAVAVDWLWEIAVVPIAFLFVAAAIVRSDDGAATRVPLAGRIVVPLLALGAIAAIGIPMLSERHVVRSQEEFRAGDLDAALAEAEDAADLQPFAATPRMQMALVYERMDPPALKKAANAAQAAVDRESRNWETWYVLSRIQAQREGKRKAALRALREAQSLDPFNPLLNPAGLPG
jgi:tetratricopeptide (TPR) repeat protein